MYIIQQAYLEPSAHIQTAHVSIHGLPTQQMMASCLLLLQHPHIFMWPALPTLGVYPAWLPPSALLIPLAVFTPSLPPTHPLLSLYHNILCLTLYQPSHLIPPSLYHNILCLTLYQPPNLIPVSLYHNILRFNPLPTFPSHPCITKPQHSLFNPLPTFPSHPCITKPQHSLFNPLPSHLIPASRNHNILRLTLYQPALLLSLYRNIFCLTLYQSSHLSLFHSNIPQHSLFNPFQPSLPNCPS